MDSLRRVSEQEIGCSAACSRCGIGEGQWDQIAGKPCCPRCEEGLAIGEGPALVERTEKNSCAVCSHLGTIRFLTFPLSTSQPVEMDLCPDHFRSLLARRLGPFAYHQLRRRLDGLGVSVDRIFLLHDAFYDVQGRALQPAIEVE